MVAILSWPQCGNTRMSCLALMPNWNRLIHSPRLVAVGRSVGYNNTWHHPFLIGWFKYKLGLPQLQWIVGSCNWWEFLQFLKATDSPYAQPFCVLLGLCKKTVKESRTWKYPTDYHTTYQLTGPWTTFPTNNFQIYLHDQYQEHLTENAWVPVLYDHIVYKSTLVQVMAWCH